MQNETNIGQLIISFDFEIGWGVWESERWRLRQARGVYRNLRPALKRFITFLDEREIALTWATVGAMISPRASDEFAYLPANAQAHIARFLAEAEPETVDGRDLFDIVTGGRVKQQIASHSYSHTRFDYAGMTHEARVTDLTKSRAALRAAGHDGDALVFPENIVLDWPALAKAGFRIGRTAAPALSPTGIGPLDRVLARSVATPPMVREVEGEGVTQHSGSLFFNWYGKGASIRRQLVVHQAKKAISHAAATGETAHLWLHPFNLTDSVGMADALVEILEYAQSQREREKLRFAPFTPAVSQHG